MLSVAVTVEAAAASLGEMYANHPCGYESEIAMLRV